ncbi:ThiF family adenylyltransferase [Mesorhizobium sp. M0954]|uniref:ThiF family adenylyltransferase n=1 Tax=Mesorhizobium sp. M0954 TaxID=2957032 RepID=UPI0033355B83
MPQNDERELHGGVSFLPKYFDRVVREALKEAAGIAFLHNHFTPGWQPMSGPDVVAEERLAPRVFGATGLPLVGLTMGADGALSARFWPRVGRGEFRREWCGTVRSIGEEFTVTFMDELVPKPEYRDVLRRTYSAWGVETQNTLARLHYGLIGAGSVGAFIAEALVRMGAEIVTLIDFDSVKGHNLDRLLHATVEDVGRLKVDVASDVLKRHATSASVEIRPFPLSIATGEGLKAALDCDILFSCVDRPWPRQVLNMMANAHLVPVVDGGVLLSVTPNGRMRGADWRAHIAMPGRPCLECLGQYKPADVALEREGFLDDPTYIKDLPRDHFIHRNENVFPFAMNASGLMILQMLSLLAKPSGISNPGGRIFHFATETVDQNQLHDCKSECLFASHISLGDQFPFPVI